MSFSGGAKAALPIEGDLTHSRAGERYAQVVDSLLEQGGPSGQVLVTSAGEEEGKTTTAVNLAFAFHARRKSILLAELSFVRPSFSSLFGPSPLLRGIEDVVAGTTPLKSVVCVRNDNNLSVAMVNKRQETNELLSPSERFEFLLSEARSQYAWTIFDGASVSSLPQVESLAASIGLVLVVARARRTHSDSLQQAVQRINRTGTLVLLNDE